MQAVTLVFVNEQDHENNTSTDTGGSDVLSASPDVALVSRATSDEQFQTAVGWSRERPAGAVKVRCELRLFNPSARQYYHWPGASWALELTPDVAKGREFRELIERLFETVTLEGMARVRERLR